MSSFFYTFSIQLLDAGRAEQNLEKLAIYTIFSQKACVKLPLDFSRICGIIILVKRGYALKLIQKPKAPTDEQKRGRGKSIQKIF